MYFNLNPYNSLWLDGQSSLMDYIHGKDICSSYLSESYKLPEDRVFRGANRRSKQFWILANLQWSSHYSSLSIFYSSKVVVTVVSTTSAAPPTAKPATSAKNYWTMGTDFIDRTCHTKPGFGSRGAFVLHMPNIPCGLSTHKMVYDNDDLLYRLKRKTIRK